MDFIALDCTISPRDPFSDLVISELAAIGYDMFEDHEDGIIAYIGADVFREEDLGQLTYFNQNDFCTVKWKSSLIKGKNWNEEWEKNFKPVVIDDKILVRAAFHEPQPGFEYHIVIQPKMAFGTGHHETTSLMMSQMLRVDFSGKKTLDMGCGSGILAILAAMLGAANILAVDYDENATANARENFIINNFPGIITETGSAEIIEGNIFDIILANINRNILLAQMKAYGASLLIDGILLISGFYEPDESVILEEAKRHGFFPHNRSVMNNWCILQLVKK